LECKVMLHSSDTQVTCMSVCLRVLPLTNQEQEELLVLCLSHKEEGLANLVLHCAVAEAVSATVAVLLKGCCRRP